ncbi:MAG: hypothetical protein AAGC85_01845 [Bacteroidota bacterium]
MKYKTLSSISLLTTLMVLNACSHKSSQEEIAAVEDQFTQDEFSLTGDYHWSFQLMGGTQHSVHTFFADSIDYTMEGKVYSTDYTMKKLSFDQTRQKWIGRDENGFVYVLFFKEQTDSTLTIYKRKCKANGIEEALSFSFPEANATEDHGWNVYTYSHADVRDVLPISGTFHYDAIKLDITDSLVVLDEKEFRRLSYHQGERRWVGEHDTTYLQIFFEEAENDQELSLSVAIHTDLEKTYRIKYQEVEFLPYNRQFQNR